MKVVSVSISEKKGTTKTPVSSIELDNLGVVGDAHAGPWHRQVSLLAKESIDRFSKKSETTFTYGDFAENIATEGKELVDCKIGDRMTIGDVQLEVTQIGKECHGGGCAIFRAVGKCVMPKEGVFTRVLSGGTVQPDDEITYESRPLQAAIITLSDRASRGEYEDRSGPALRKCLEKHLETSHWGMNIDQAIMPDESEQLQGTINQMVADGVSVIFTTGGTGIGPRDIAPDVIRPMLDKEIPGIMEFIRTKYGEKIPSALLSRSIAGTIDQTLIYTLPGSVKAVKEYMTEILRTLDHSLFMLKGIDVH
jgi:molybdopterin adenylyltransferase